ncbi:hypothetical protein C8R47DRAFT_668061 [Mycena vitilis]|nr:hypothetical protein C8R47DRAFT_668061 [Mycena vitilis]
MFQFTARCLSTTSTPPSPPPGEHSRATITRHSWILVTHLPNILGPKLHMAGHSRSFPILEQIPRRETPAVLRRFPDTGIPCLSALVIFVHSPQYLYCAHIDRSVASQEVRRRVIVCVPLANQFFHLVSLLGLLTGTLLDLIPNLIGFQAESRVRTKHTDWYTLGENTLMCVSSSGMHATWRRVWPRLVVPASRRALGSSRRIGGERSAAAKWATCARQPRVCVSRCKEGVRAGCPARRGWALLCRDTVLRG